MLKSIVASKNKVFQGHQPIFKTFPKAKKNFIQNPGSSSTTQTLLLQVMSLVPYTDTPHWILPDWPFGHISIYGHTKKLWDVCKS